MQPFIVVAWTKIWSSRGRSLRPPHKQPKSSSLIQKRSLLYAHDITWLLAIHNLALHRPCLESGQTLLVRSVLCPCWLWPRRFQSDEAWQPYLLPGINVTVLKRYSLTSTQSLPHLFHNLDSPSHTSDSADCANTVAPDLSWTEPESGGDMILVW